MKDLHHSYFSQNLPFVAFSSLGKEPAHGSHKHENTLGLSLCLDLESEGLCLHAPLTLQTAPTSASDSTLWPYMSYIISLQSVTYSGKPPRKSSRLENKDDWQVVKVACSTTQRKKKCAFRFTYPKDCNVHRPHHLGKTRPTTFINHNPHCSEYMLLVVQQLSGR